MSATEASAWPAGLREEIDLGKVSETEPPNHPLLVKVTGWLTQIVLGDEATRMLADLDERSDGHAVELGLRVGQVWMWREPKIPVGRKGRAKGGASYALPIRVTWESGHLQLGNTGRSRLRSRWSATGMGWDLSGVAGSVPFGHELPGAEFVCSASVPAMTGIATDVRTALNGLVEHGRSARWEFLLWLQPTVSSALRRAHSSIRAEMGDPRTGTLGAPVVDQVKLDQLRDQMMFGDDTHSSAAERLLKLCTSPGTFRR
ncbi:MAG TPA: hypothetical protein VIT65_10225, partial [Microlunatus sp.]